VEDIDLVFIGGGVSSILCPLTLTHTELVRRIMVNCSGNRIDIRDENKFFMGIIDLYVCQSTEEPSLYVGTKSSTLNKIKFFIDSIAKTILEISLPT